MCLWLLTACLGLLPGNPSPSIVVVPAGVPAPIVVPTPAPRPAPTVRPTAAPTAPPTVRPTAPPTARPTAAPTTGPPITVAPTSSPTRQTPIPTRPPPTTAAPTTTSRATVATTTTARATVASTTAIPSTVITTSTAGGVIISVQICNTPQIVCVTNPDDERNTGPLPIDPRLGTTPAAFGAQKAPQINGYSAQVPSYDSAVKFPRSRRSLEGNPEMSVKNFLMKTQMGTDIKHQIRKRQSCACVPVGTCTGTIAAAGNIDFRVVNPTQTAPPTSAQCPAGQVYCCGSSTPAPRVPVACGTQQAVPAVAVTPTAPQAKFGEYPWQALILTKQNDYIGGGVLIDQFNVVTVTHRITPYIVSGTAPNVKVRLGEWDAAGTYEPIPFQEYSVTKVFSHPSYNPGTLQFDITVLRLAAPVPLTPMNGAAPTINRACLPPAPNSTYTGQRCWVSGWGKDMFGLQGQYQQILKKVDVPIVAPATCQAQLQNARLGAGYVFDSTSFLCAGGEASKDSCTGDGGSGLVCLVNGQWVVVGLVSWGLGCANPNVPAVYVNVAALLPWIRQQVATA